jgi:DNA-binding protein HU-beta
MTKENFITEVAAKAEISKKDAKAAVRAFMETLTEALAADEKVSFVGFGTFEIKTRAARTGRNPRTGETMEIPATKVPHFKPGKSLKDAVNA